MFIILDDTTINRKMKPDRNPIRWGILATGNIASNFANDFEYVNDGEIHAVASREEARARSFAQNFGIESYYGDYNSLIEDDSIDVIYIATPHHLHQELAIHGLKRKKAILCEKPIAVNLGQLQDMIGSAKASNSFLMEAMWMYFLPAIRKVRQWIDEGKIGDIRHIEAEFGFKATYDPERRLFNPNLAGGALLDVGIYPIALTQEMVDSKITTINAHAEMGTTQVDEKTMMKLEYESGVTAELSCSLVNNLSNTAVITGTKGKITIPKFWRAVKSVLQLPQGINKEFKDGRRSKGYQFEIEEVNSALREEKKESKIMPLSRSLEIIAIMDQIRDQIELIYPFE